MTGSTGDAYKMAMATGAKDTLQDSAPLITNFVKALPLGNGRDLLAGGPALWINQDGSDLQTKALLIEMPSYSRNHLSQLNKAT